MITASHAENHCFGSKCCPLCSCIIQLSSLWRNKRNIWSHGNSTEFKIQNTMMRFILEHVHVFGVQLLVIGSMCVWSSPWWLTRCTWGGTYTKVDFSCMNLFCSLTRWTEMFALSLLLLLFALCASLFPTFIWLFASRLCCATKALQALFFQTYRLLIWSQLTFGFERLKKSGCLSDEINTDVCFLLRGRTNGLKTFTCEIRTQFE